jgi:hypothetical protein
MEVHGDSVTRHGESESALFHFRPKVKMEHSSTQAMICVERLPKSTKTLTQNNPRIKHGTSRIDPIIVEHYAAGTR